MASKHPARALRRTKPAPGRLEALKLPELLRSLLDEPGRAGIDRIANAFGMSKTQLAAAHRAARDRKSTRLNSSHEWISYAVFCLKKKKKTNNTRHPLVIC